MMINRVPEKSPNFRKFENCRIWSILISRASVVLKFFLIQTSIFFKMLQKDETVFATGDRIYGPLNWVHITVMSMGKISFAPLNNLSSVYGYLDVCIFVNLMFKFQFSKFTNNCVIISHENICCSETVLKSIYNICLC